MDNCTQCIWSGKCSTEGSGLNCNEFTARTEPDATLIAAAPELLAAAKLIRVFTTDVNLGCDCERCNAIRQLDTIITKAEGTQ